MIKNIKFFTFNIIILLSSVVRLNAIDEATLNATDIYLVTVGSGAEVHAKYGHSLLRIRNNITKDDYGYNWGVFNFDEKNFVYRFVKAKVDYIVNKTIWYKIPSYYRDYERRSVTQNKLILSNLQKEDLLNRVALNMLPENIKLRYHQYYNNCATKIRDHLNDVFKDSLKSELSQKKSTKNYRMHINESSLGLWWLYVGLDIILNNKSDQQITLWQEMFLPDKLQQHLLDLKILEKTEKLVEINNDYGGLDTYYILAIIFYGLFALLLFLVNNKRSKINSITLKLILLISGFLGLFLILAWGVSGHTDFYHNANLWFFWPTDLFVLTLFNKFSSKKICNYFALHIGGGVIWLVLKVVGVIEQNSMNLVISVVLPVMFIYILQYYRIKKGDK